MSRPRPGFFCFTGVGSTVNSRRLTAAGIHLHRGRSKPGWLRRVRRLHSRTATQPDRPCLCFPDLEVEGCFDIILPPAMPFMTPGFTGRRLEALAQRC